MTQPQTGADLAVRGGEVVDGTGAARYRADVLVRAGRILALVPPGEGRARATLDARGRIVCPGFIDSHSHDDMLVLQPAVPHPKLSQGVTTVVTGNCGISAAPLPAGELPPPLDILALGSGRFATFADYLRALDAAPLVLNVVPLVGHTSLRLGCVRDLARPADAAEIAAMHAACAAALAAGAFGLSTGVYYPPAAAAGRAELLGVCAALGGHGVLAMHIRDEGDHVLEAVDEALAIGAATGAQLVLSHHKVVGPRNWGRTAATLQRIAHAAATQRVCVDCYPYEASSTMLSPAKAAATGDVLVTWSRPHPEAAGRPLRSLAAQWGVDLATAAQRLLPAGAIYFGMSPHDVDRVLAHPLAMVGSDGLPHDRRPHPRLWGSFPRVLGRYVRERGLFPLEQAVHKMTGLPARVFGLADRGVVRAGAAADLVVLDAARVADLATYDDPARAAAGIEAVIVNGAVALRDGGQPGAQAGVRLRPAHAQPSR